MAAYDLYSHSPQVSDVAAPQYRVPGPITPIHSPHHSIHSSTSLRTPLYTLSIHEYRKQQKTPLSRIATPSGRTLRRKASAFALNEIERVTWTKSAPRRDSHSSPQVLPSSNSAHQLTANNSFCSTQPVSDQVSRSQSAEPKVFDSHISSVAIAGHQNKVRRFGTRKRLPRPLAPTSSGFQAQSHAPVRPTQQVRATLPAPLSFLTEDSNLSDAPSTPTPSLSRFPQPPQFGTLRETQREKAISFATTAPETPPATPATIHYRGASFDLVNPHASLPYHDIVTPSRDFDSSELLPLRLSQESHPSISEMAHKRPLYGDLNAAHAGIVRRTEDTYLLPTLDLPLPPTPAAISPGSSTYTSPVYSPESHFAPSPLAVRRVPDESRFSIKQLARTLTKKLVKPLERNEDEEELQQFGETRVGELSFGAESEPLRPLENTHIPRGRSSYFPISPVSPTSPISPTSLQDFGMASYEGEGNIEHARRGSGHNYISNDLTSMVPDDQSQQISRAEELYGSVRTVEPELQPYYDDLESIYASSSVYTGDDRRRSTYQQSPTETRQNSALLHYSGLDATEIANEYSYNDLGKSGREFSKPLTNDLYQRSELRGDGKTDTISKLIDQYDPENTDTISAISQDPKSASIKGVVPHYASDHEVRQSTAAPRELVPLSRFSQFHFDLESAKPLDIGYELDCVPPTNAAKRAPKHLAGAPPSIPLPLAPAFQYDQTSHPITRPELSNVFSNTSYCSYGDTRHLLQLPQSESDERKPNMQSLPCSSSYSQLDTNTLDIPSSTPEVELRASPNTPQEALDHAELIFDKAAAVPARSREDIPAMWGRRSPANLPRNKRFTEDFVLSSEDERADWETVDGDSQRGRLSLDSIADYSSSDGSRNSLGLTPAASPPSWNKQKSIRGPSFYSQTSPARAHAHLFSSSPPQVAVHPGSQTAPDVSVTGTPTQPLSSSTMPIFQFSNHPRRAVVEPYAFAPWADPYALSDKETQELLASGPNDDILFDNTVEDRSKRLSYKFKNHEGLFESSSPRSVGVVRENTFDKFTVVGRKGNLTGTPQGTGMRDTGSSIADTSSPGARLNSSPRSDYCGFYASPFPATGSVTQIRESSFLPEHQHDRSSSQVTLFPGAYSMEPVQASSPLAGADGQGSLGYSTTFKPARRASRAAVPGQTKLRQMVLAPDARSLASSKATRFSRFMGAGGSERPSTSDTATPLYPTHPSLDTFPTIRSGNTVLAHQHSPHLLCPERKVREEDEVRRRKLSWLILACFCILPPFIFLYRMWGDAIIVSVTKGDLGHCTAKSKRAALIAGVVVNIGLITAILVPILVAQALKAI